MLNMQVQYTVGSKAAARGVVVVSQVNLGSALTNFGLLQTCVTVA